ncbi:hypothetical protein KCG44_10395 [Pacificimonas sp. WHA3]|uniref:Ribosomal protein L7/L12 C-terminal domain-containing protein n=1 Tax=Pacificimonas pallii TaxID=2827236 RepID=A0ABS6SH22_9SPHN|nr:hypothetical protein [Pacificimonas pallii]MBV7257191.1 hypothetical protein [Pacificimonas pallii]
MDGVLYAFAIFGAGFGFGVWWTKRGQVPADPEAAARAAAQMRTEDRLHVSTLIKEGRKIDAIREVRSRTRCGLKEAKEIADHLEASDPATGIG